MTQALGRTPLIGGCLCGAVRYSAPAPSDAPTLCHCQSCRRSTGAHIVGLFTVRKAQVVFADSVPTEYRSSPDVQRGFCSRCGTSLTYWHAHWPQDLSLTIASLDDPNLVTPTDHTGMSDAASWDVPRDGLPQSPSVRPD